MGLHNKLYKRFGLEYEIQIIQNGFKGFVEDLFCDPENGLKVLIKPDYYEQSQKLNQIKFKILKESCRLLFLQYSTYNNFSASIDNKEFLNLIKDISKTKDFNNYIAKIQIILDLVFKEKYISTEYFNFIDNVSKHLEDFPEIGLKIKVYKTKSSQFLPIISSKVIEKNIDNALGLLETKKYMNTLNSFENGLKLFLLSKDSNSFKDVVEDMSGTLDEFVKEFLGDKNKSFKDVSKNFSKFGLNGNNKEIFNQTKRYIDDIKHGKEKEINRNHIEMIISLTGIFINFVTNNSK